MMMMVDGLRGMGKELTGRKDNVRCGLSWWTIEAQANED